MKLNLKRKGENILCIDVGMRFTGVAVYAESSQSFIHTSVICTEKEEGPVTADDVRRCREIATGLVAVLEKYRPSFVVAELPHGGAQSSKACSSMAMAKAVTITVMHLKGVRLVNVTPSEIKKQVAPNSKKVEKGEVIAYARARFGESIFPPKKGLHEHIADAACLIDVWAARKVNAR